MTAVSTSAPASAGPRYQALLLDALHQVLDNKVFRILLVLALLPVLLTFLVAFREDEVVILFGWKRLDYQSLGWLGAGGVQDLQGVVVDTLISLVFDSLTGTFGVMICLVATAFFVPQMIEKGAADVLFHKPLTRFALYLWRYFAGLLFVALLTSVMAVGTFAGLSLCSGYVDPGLLAAIFTLTYGFGLVYAVSMLFGIVTRSAVAAILCTFVFMFANGCIVQEAWKFKESWVDLERVVLAEETDAGELQGVTDPLDTVNPWLRAGATAADVLHYALPMTADAKIIGRELRRAVNTLPYQDGDTGVSFFRLPRGSQRVEPSRVEVPTTLAERFGPPRFALTFADEDAHVTLHRRERSKQVADGNESSRDAANELVAALGGDAARSSGTVGSGSRGKASAANVVRWPRGPRASVAVLFRADDFLYALHVDLPAAGSAELVDDLRHRIDDDFGVYSDSRGGGTPWGQWYEERAGFDAPLPYNLWFSMARSLAFVALVLLLGWWRLARMDF